MNTYAMSIIMCLVVGVCMVIYYPFTTNCNLIKELLWWSMLPGCMGVWLAMAPRWNLQNAKLVCMNLWRRGFWPILLLSLWLAWGGTVGVWRAPDTIRALAFWGRLAGYCSTGAAIAIIFSSRRSQRWLIMTLINVGTLIAIYTLVQSVGFDVFAWPDLRRPPGAFGNPNFTANLLACLVPLAAVWEIQLRRMGNHEPDRSGRNFNSLRLPWIRSIPVRSSIMVLAILVTQSRGGMIALTVGVVVLGIIYIVNLKSEGEGPGNEKRSSRRLLLQLTLCAILFVEVALGLVYWLAPDRLVHISSLTTIQVRLQMWKGSFMLWLERPALGHGLGSFTDVSCQFSYLLEPVAGEKHALHAHSWLIELLVEHGVVGAAIFVAALASVLWSFAKDLSTLPRRRDRAVLGAIWAGLAALLAGTLVGVWLNWWGGAWILWILIGLGTAVWGGKSLNAAHVEYGGNDDDKSIEGNTKFVRIIGVLFIALAILIGGVSWRYFQSERYLWIARRMADHQRFDISLTALESANKYFPLSSSPTYWRGACLLNQGDARQAERVLLELTQSRPFDVRAFRLLGQCYMRQGRFELAERAYAKTHELEPSGQNAVNWAHAWLALGRNSKALALLEAQLQREVYTPVLHLYLKAQRESGNDKAARDYLRTLRHNRSLSLRDQGRAELARWDAELSMLLGDLAGAIAAYYDALQIDKNNFELWNDLALAFKRARLPMRADQAYSKAINLHPGHYAPLINRLELALDQGNVELARELIVRLDAVQSPNTVKERVLEIKRELNFD